MLIGLLASRERVAKLMDCRKEELGKLLCRAALNPIEPVVSEEKAPCQEVIHKVTDPDFDLFKLFPAPTNTPVDAGPYHNGDVLRNTPGYWMLGCDDPQDVHSVKG